MKPRWHSAGLSALLLLMVLSPTLTVAETSLPADTPPTSSYPDRDHSTWWQGWVGDGDENGLDDRLDTALTGSIEPDQTVPIFLIYDHMPTDEELDAVEKLVRVDYRAHHVELLTIYEAPLALVPDLLELPGVKQIQQQNQMVPFLDHSVRAHKARPSNDYQDENVWQTLDYDGTGINVAVLDTGVDDEHETMQNKFVAGYDATSVTGDPNNGNGQTNPDDGAGHGTHVASTVLGNPDNGEFMGVAPGAGLIDVKVMTDAGVSNSGYTQEGIEWCIDHKNDFDIRVLSMSFGSATGNDDGSSAEAETVNRAVEAGLIAVIAVGNDGDHRVPSPASADLAITVAAADDHNTVLRDDDTIATYSNFGPRLDDGDENDQDELKPEITGFGTNIEAAQHNSFGPATNGYTEMDGTSMATPHISGILALMLDANPSLTPKQAERALLWAAEDSQETGRENHMDEARNPRYTQHWGWGLADAYRAVQAALGGIVEVEITSPYDAMTIQGRVKFEGTAEGNELDRVELHIHGETYIAEGTEQWSFFWDSRTVPNGSVIIKAMAIAAENLTSSTVITLNIENPPGSADKASETTMEKFEGFINDLKENDAFPIAIAGLGLALVIVILAIVIIRRRGDDIEEDW